MTRLFFFLVASLIWGGAHVYIGRRLLTASRAPTWVARLGWGILALDVISAWVAMGSRRLDFTLPLGDLFQWVAYLGMGLFVFVLVLVLARDLVMAMWWAITAWRSRGKRKDVSSERPQGVIGRREFFLRASSAGIVATGASAGAYGYLEARRLARVKHVHVPVEGLDARLEGFRIIQLSDIHVGPTIKRPYLEAIVERVNELDAHLVAVTGDLVDGTVERMRDEVSPIATMRSTYGTFFVTGNHEYYWDGPAWARELERQGVRVLLNTHEVIDHQGAKLVVGGATDYSAKRHEPSHASDPAAAIEGVPQDAALKLLLAHQPKSIWAASEAGWDLQLSGHTHGGQFWPWNLVVGLAHPFIAGLHRFEEKIWIYVSRGTGYWGPPMRLGAPSEITVLELTRASDAPPSRAA